MAERSIKCWFCNVVSKLWWRYCRGDFLSSIGFDDMSGATITFAVGEQGHTAVATNTNLDGTPATDAVASFSSDNPSVCTVDASSGALEGLTAGTANITETSVRGAFTHTDSGVAAITGGDFNTALTFT